VEITPLVIFSLLKLSPVSKINAAISEYDMFFINSDLNGSAMEEYSDKITKNKRYCLTFPDEYM
ncbi:hypothetical protein, partial [Escherichia coli]|uniref:hypothetical protein n=1 Tax=Escherichia coli TaxID=562 RepID=UPI001BC8629F